MVRFSRGFANSEHSLPNLNLFDRTQSSITQVHKRRNKRKQLGNLLDNG